RVAPRPGAPPAGRRIGRGWRQPAGAPAPPARHRPPPRPTRRPPRRWPRRRPVPAAPAGPTPAGPGARRPPPRPPPPPTAAPAGARPSPAHRPTRRARRHAADRPGRRWRTARTPDARRHSTQCPARTGGALGRLRLAGCPVRALTALARAMNDAGMDGEELLDRVRALRATGRTPKEIARALGPRAAPGGPP